LVKLRRTEKNGAIFWATLYVCAMVNAYRFGSRSVQGGYDSSRKNTSGKNGSPSTVWQYFQVWSIRYYWITASYRC